MALPALRDDALSDTDTGFALRIALPWIRSLPVSSVLDLELTIDGERVDAQIALDRRAVSPLELRSEPGWWFLQDRLVVIADRVLDRRGHEVSVSFRLFIPYLSGPGGQALEIPVVARRSLTPGAAPTAPTVSLDVA